ncbi:hypothetical protein EVAR_7819_1 [Eumeta japonica]|uniref:Uncharacterized protein n=1 Tax=Eumeta variegata TaxID=151549 RepID=A0A4C1TVW7_EUMVA|nr:hypothetical protein EVAR_7819_1 [Eumeta japonica]
MSFPAEGRRAAEGVQVEEVGVVTRGGREARPQPPRGAACTAALHLPPPPRPAAYRPRKTARDTHSFLLYISQMHRNLYTPKVVNNVSKPQIRFARFTGLNLALRLAQCGLRAVAQSEDTPIAMKLKKIWLKTPVGEEQAAQAVLDPALVALSIKRSRTLRAVRARKFYDALLSIDRIAPLFGGEPRPGRDIIDLIVTTDRLVTDIKMTSVSGYVSSV